MKGFKIKINDKEIQAALPTSLVSVMLTRVKSSDRNETSINIRGVEGDKNYLWMHADVEEEEIITVQFTKLHQVSEAKITSHDEEAFNKFIIKSKIASYQKLKEGLDAGGHI